MSAKIDRQAAERKESQRPLGLGTKVKSTRSSEQGPGTRRYRKRGRMKKEEVNHAKGVRERKNENEEAR